MRTAFVLLLTAATTFLSLTAYAELDAASHDALQQTSNLLGDQRALEEYAKSHPDAAAAHQQVQSLTGGNAEDSAAVYKLANEIFTNMAKDSNRDLASLQQTLASAMKNPEGFASKLSAEQRAELKALSKKIEARKPTSAPH